MSGFDATKMEETLRKKLDTYEKLRGEGRHGEAFTKLLEAIRYTDYILAKANEEIKNLSEEVPGLPEELVNRISNLDSGPDKPPEKKFIVIPKQTLPC